MSKAYNEKVKSLLMQALDGRLNLTEMFKKWPEGSMRGPFLDAVKEDLEDAVEHFPCSLFSKKPDFNMWYKGREYLLLRLDLLLIDAEKEEDILLKGRQIIGERKNISVEDLAKEVDDYLKKEAAKDHC